MQLSLPSRRRAARFIAVFYAATAVLFFGSYCAVGSCSWGPVFNGIFAALWPLDLSASLSHVAMLAGGATVGALEPRLTGVGN